MKHEPAEVLRELADQIRHYPRLNSPAFDVQSRAFGLARTDMVLNLPCRHEARVPNALRVAVNDGKPGTVEAMIVCPMCGERAAVVTIWPPLP